MKRVRVKSNFARDRVIVLDNGRLVLHFDYEGYALCPEHLLPVLEVEMRARPGRYRVVAEAKSDLPDVPVSKESVEVRKQVTDLLSSLKASREVEKSAPAEKPAEVAPKPAEKVVEKQAPKLALPKKLEVEARPKRRRKKNKKSTEE